MKIYLYILTFVTVMLIIQNIKFRVEKRQDLDFGKHFKPKKHFLFERCTRCGKRLKHYHWFWGKGDFMGCEVDYDGNTNWFCEVCENELNDNVLQSIPTNICTQITCVFNSDFSCQKPDYGKCPLSNAVKRSDTE